MPASPSQLTPELESFRTQFEQIAVAAQSLTHDLSDEQFNWSPDAARWSMAQCIDHLNVTARTYLPMIDDGIAEAIGQGLYRPGPYRYNLFGRLFVRFMEPPPRRRFTAPKTFQPMPWRGKAETLAAFRAYQVQFIDRLRQANGLDLARARARSPVARFRIPLGSAFALMAAHERRHLWQAEQVRMAPGFPSIAA